MKIYTKTGDMGETSLIGGQRTPKDDARIEAYGTIDELNAALGLAISFLPKEAAPLHQVLEPIQHHLFTIGAELAALSKTPAKRRTIPIITATHITWLERQIDVLENELPPLRQFILPGGQQSAALLHVARTIGRRAERHIVALRPKHVVPPNLLAYSNRLSDLLFVAARYVNKQTETTEQFWQKE